MTSHPTYWRPKISKMAAMLVSQTNPWGVEPFSSAKMFFFFNEFLKLLAT